MQRAKGMDPDKLWILEEGGSPLQKDDTLRRSGTMQREMSSGKIGPGTMWNKKPVKNRRSGRYNAQNQKAAKS
jgi:hypothetical protein